MAVERDAKEMEGAAVPAAIVPAAIVQQQPGEPDAKRAKHSATVRDGAAQRRSAGLRHYAVVEHPWLSCSVDYELNLADLDKQHRPGVKYVTADGGARQGGDEDVLWHCGDCHALPRSGIIQSSSWNYLVRIG